MVKINQLFVTQCLRYIIYNQTMVLINNYQTLQTPQVSFS